MSPHLLEAMNALLSLVGGHPGEARGGADESRTERHRSLWVRNRGETRVAMGAGLATLDPDQRPVHHRVTDAAPSPENVDPRSLSL
jgi:hypothetical protein